MVEGRRQNMASVAHVVSGRRASSLTWSLPRVFRRRGPTKRHWTLASLGDARANSFGRALTLLFLCFVLKGTVRATRPASDPFCQSMLASQPPSPLPTRLPAAPKSQNTIVRARDPACEDHILANRMVSTQQPGPAAMEKNRTRTKERRAINLYYSEQPCAPEFGQGMDVCPRFFGEMRVLLEKHTFS